jgi:hypothetical protein
VLMGIVVLGLGAARRLDRPARSGWWRAPCRLWGRRHGADDNKPTTGLGPKID